MKTNNKLLLLIVLLVVPILGMSQKQSQSERKEDVAVNRYELTNYKWNKTNLSYYINNISNHLTAQQREDAIRAAMDIWSAFTGFVFTQTNNSNADIRFSWETGYHGGSPDTIFTSIDFGHTIPYHEIGSTNLTKAIIHFNDSVNWVISDTPVANNNEVDLIHNAMHEIGHALGLGESDTPGDIMYQGNRSGRNLYFSDLTRIWTLYRCPFSINGPSHFCNTADYTMNLPNILSPVYSAYGALTSISEQSDTVTVSKEYDGMGNLSATIKYDNTNDFWTVYYDNIAVGIVALGNAINFSTATGVCGCWASNMINNTFTLENNLSWAYDRVEAQLYRMDNNFNPTQLVQSWYNINTTGGASIPGYTAGWYLFKLRGVNDCGYSDWLEQEVEMVDFSMLNFLLDYEAASETLTLTLIEPDSQNSQGAEANSQSISRGTYEIQLWNGIYSTMARSYKTDLTKYQMSLAGLPKGIYIVRVVIDGKTYSKKFVKR